MVELPKFDEKIKRQVSLPALVFGIQRLVAMQIRSNFLLCQVVIFPEIADSESHINHRSNYILVQYVLLNYWTNSPKICLR